MGGAKIDYGEGGKREELIASGMGEEEMRAGEEEIVAEKDGGWKMEAERRKGKRQRKVV